MFSSRRSSSVKGQITSIVEMGPGLVNAKSHMAVCFAGAGTREPSHFVYGQTPRGVSFVFAVSAPDLFPVGASVEVWGKAFHNGGRDFGGSWEGAKVDGRAIFIREGYGVAPEPRAVAA